jgi:hypothetical protein
LYLEYFPSLGGRGKGRGDLKNLFNELMRLDARFFYPFMKDGVLLL